MSFFGRILASVGIGSAKVDTVLETSSYAPGDEVRGVVRIEGGAVEQRIDGIVLTVMSQYVREVNDSKLHQNAEIARIRVTEPFVLAPGSREEVPFSFYLPRNTPLSIGRTPVWIKTNADIQSAVDPTDEDRIHIMPSRDQKVVLDAIDMLGFRLKQTETVYAPRLGGSLPFVQEFEWIPGGGRYRGRLDELELMFLGSRGDGLTLLLQIDRKATSIFGLFAEAMDTDETFVRVELSGGDLGEGLSHVAGVLANIIDRYS
ncbi:sporulation protein [Cohnella massiliensis]|uniref:sporulation protein n=1 Tax=Cohnella massiliensis TaxID=1816691 RepID=UPI0009BC3F67|nr:sporulation protein [Cohnella massiliensis]